MMPMDARIEARLNELESRLAFQDDTIEILNETVARQDREMARLELRFIALADKLSDLAESSAVPGGTPADEAPPHY